MSASPLGRRLDEALERVGDLAVAIAEQARAVRAALAERLPGHEADLQAGFEALEADLAEARANLGAPGEAIESWIASGRPYLGICLGMQALLDHSEENQGTDCLGLIPGNVRHFPGPDPDNSEGERLKIPHMGWNQVQQQRGQSMWTDIPNDSRFYFVHSYYVETSRAEDVAATTRYGIEFASVLVHENIFAVQFHPEKSQHAGLQLLSNFVHWNGDS